MANAKTVENNSSVIGFLHKIPDEKKKADCVAILEIMKAATGYEPKMWGPAIVGFGSYHYKYESGREGDAPLIGFSPRKQAITLYIANFQKKEELLQSLGKHKSAKVCVYFKALEDIDISILKKMIKESVRYMKAKYLVA